LEKSKRIYNLNIPIVGITGGIGSGKSTLLRYLSKKGFATLSADDLVKQIYRQKDTIDFVKTLVNFDEIDFKKLRILVFSNDQIRKTLERHIYQRLPATFKRNLPAKAPLIFYEVPLLFEKKLSKLFDAIIIVTAPPSRILRLRKKMSMATIGKIMKLQLNHSATKRRGHYYISNDSSKKEFFTKIDALIKTMAATQSLPLKLW
jgi:dephospho-CoA kinase